MLRQRSGRIILGNPEAGNVTVIRLLQQPKGGAGYCDSLDILLQWNSAPFTAGDAIPSSIQIKGAGLVIRAFLSRFEIPRPRPSSIEAFDFLWAICQALRRLKQYSPHAAIIWRRSPSSLALSYAPRYMSFLECKRQSSTASWSKRRLLPRTSSLAHVLNEARAVP